MTTEPLWYRWNGAAMMPRRPELAERQFVVGGIYLLEAHHERSYKRHRAYFASINEAWASLGTDDFATPEHLRKFALIKTGWRDERTLVCASYSEAKRIAEFVRPIDDYAIVLSEGNLLRVWTAKSQSHRAMGKDDFNKSMDDVLDYCASLIGVEVGELAKQGEPA